MSRLLPDSRVVVGIFPGLSWIRLGGKGPYVRSNSVSSAGTLPLLADLDALLGENRDVQRPGRRVSVIASDSIAAVTTLPWRDELTGVDEVRGFALAWFGRQHHAVDHEWVLHAGYRNFRRMGLAHAFPRRFVEELTALLGQHGLILERVLPVSAWAYWGDRPPRQAGARVVIVREPARHSALVLDRHGLLAHDVEVIAGAQAASARRLLQRVCAYHPDIKHIWHWSCNPLADDAGMADLAQSLPGTAVSALKRVAWI